MKMTTFLKYMTAFVTAAGMATSANATTYTATWGTAPWDWTGGNTEKIIQVDTTPDGSNVDVNVSVDYGTLTGNRYGRPSYDDVPNGFAGNIDDLGVVLDPDANQGTSPITITLTFNHPMYNTSFIISDIDSRITNGSLSTDQVTVTSDVGNPTLAAVNAANTTVTSISGNVAHSDTTTDAISTNDDKGSITVTVPDGARVVTIVYEDIYPAANSDTTARGIGLFGGLTFTTKDTDGDGILDDVDLDDDGDGIADAIETTADTDGDGIPNYLDLDSDNDGIPDNVEAQATGSYVAPSGTDADYDGLDDAYDSDPNNAAGSLGLTPVDTDNDGDLVPDYLDTDSDNDGITDCVEGHPDPTQIGAKVCPVVAANVGNNGLIDWAENNDNYSNPAGIIVSPSNDLLNETGDTTEVAYREILCGKAERQITPLNWVVVSVPCDTGTATISDLFGASLGTYGDNNNWVMYKQNTNYTGDNTQDMVQMSASDTLEMGKGYWLIVDNTNAGPDGNVTLKLNTAAAGINGKTPSVAKTGFGNVGTSDNGFDEVLSKTLPDSQSDRKTKIMLGNPFVRNIHSGRIYYSNDSLGQNYYDFTDATNLDSYVERILYMHDSPDLKPGTGGNNGEYIAVSPDTPGFGDTIAPMYGYWMLIKQDGGTTVTGNAITMPFEKK